MAIVWDQVGERRYETGIDRGVLFPQDGSSPPIPWNGLVSVTETQSQTVTPLYIDGVKYAEYHRAGEYRGTIKAFTYPDHLDRLTGLAERVGGVYLHDQQALPFHLSYRTLVGDDVNGISHYKLHIVYNAIAVIKDREYATLSADISAPTFEWDITTTPLQIVGVRPISHISFDSRRLDPESLEDIEGAVYEGIHPDPLHALGGTGVFLDSVVATP